MTEVTRTAEPRGFDSLLATLRDEIDAIESLLPAARDRQWQASPVPRPRLDTSERASGVRSDPTADVVLDARRLAVRAAVETAEVAVGAFAARLGMVRAEVERSVARFDGEDA